MNNQEMQQLAEEALGKIAESLGFQVKTTVVAPEDPEKNTFKLIVEAEKPQHIIGVVSSSVYAFSSLDLFLLRLIQSVPAAFTKQYPFALSFPLDSSSASTPAISP